MVEKKNGGKLESSFFGCAPFFWVFFFFLVHLRSGSEVDHDKKGVCLSTDCCSIIKKVSEKRNKKRKEEQSGTSKPTIQIS